MPEATNTVQVAPSSIQLTVKARHLFKLSDSNLLQVVVEHLGTVSLVRCSAERNPVSSYLVPGNGDLTMVLPGALARVLLPALSADSSADPVESALDAGGSLTPGPDESAAQQGLSDWRMSTSQVGEWITVRLSAALRTPESRSEFGYWREKDHWPVDESVPPRIAVEFRLDVMTAVVRFGGHSNMLSSEYNERVPALVERTSASAMRFGSSPIGYFGSMFGFAGDDKWDRSK